MLKKLSLIFLVLLANRAFAQTADTIFLKQMLYAHPELFNEILNHPQQHEVQIIYTQIDRDELNIPHFKTFTYRLNARHYFYPASTVKLPTIIFALEKLNNLHVKNLNSNSVMLTDSAYQRQSSMLIDTTAKNGKPSIAQYAKRILLVSDNYAYNRLYEFVGRKELNDKLKRYDLKDSRIMGRLAVGDGGDNARATNPVRFYDHKKMIYTQPLQYDDRNYPMYLDNMQQGQGYIDRNGNLISQPFDFSDKNVYQLADQQMVLKRLLFPEAFTEDQRYNLTKNDYKLIYRYMSMYPTESNYPRYNKPGYFPAYCKFLFYGGDEHAQIDPHIRIFNKVGDSYGYDIDNAYIVDFKHKVEFLLSAVVQSNEDGIYNDDKYEYQTICLPFLKNLGQVIYQYELTRPRLVKPDLSKFKFTY